MNKFHREVFYVQFDINTNILTDILNSLNCVIFSL